MGARCPPSYFLSVVVCISERWIPSCWENISELWDWQEAYLTIIKIYVYVKKTEQEVPKGKEEREISFLFSTGRVKLLSFNLYLALQTAYA